MKMHAFVFPAIRWNSRKIIRIKRIPYTVFIKSVEINDNILNRDTYIYTRTEQATNKNDIFPRRLIALKTLKKHPSERVFLSFFSADLAEISSGWICVIRLIIHETLDTSSSCSTAAITVRAQTRRHFSLSAHISKKKNNNKNTEINILSLDENRLRQKTMRRITIIIIIIVKYLCGISINKPQFAFSSCSVYAFINSRESPSSCFYSNTHSQR